MRLMAEEILVGDLVAEFLQAAGVTTAFGVVSVHNIPMLDGIGRRNAIRFVPSRGEMGAGHMADAYARSNGGLGVAFTSTGPGAANITGPLVEAVFAGSPMLHLTGQTATGNIEKRQGAVHDVQDQLGMLEATSKSAFRVRSAETALGTLIQAARTAMTPPMGPVSVEIPIDIQRTKIPRPELLDSLSITPQAADAGDAASLDLIADKLLKSKRPLLWTGNGAKFARGAVQRFIAMGIPLITSGLGRGVVPETDPMVLGAFNAVPRIEAYYKTVDCMLVAGSRIRAQETRDMSVELPANRIHIDIDPAANGRTYSSALFHVGDAEAALNALADRIEGKLATSQAYRDEIVQLKKDVHADYKKTLGVYADFSDQLRKAMPDDAMFVRDITKSHTTWGYRLFPILSPETNIYPVGAAIGPGFQLGMGAALGSGKKTVAMTGDGGFFLNLGEIWTAVQENIDCCILVMNDRQYGVIKDIQSALYGERHFFADPVGPPLDKLAELAGMPYFKCTDGSKFGATVAEALKVNGPTMVEVDMNSIGEFPAYFVPPPYATKT
jgi:acetolactate synthase I/II/III large subunit